MPCPDTFTRMPPVKVALERSSTECGESDHSVRARSSKKCANVTDAPGNDAGGHSANGSRRGALRC
jgi:hypothetical protein